MERCESPQSDCFSFPRDVKISYRHSLVLVSDYGHLRIQMFDLETRKYVNCIPLSHHPQCLELDSNDLDSVVITLSYSHVCKFRMLDRNEISLRWQIGVSNESNHANEIIDDEIHQDNPAESTNGNTLFYYPMGVTVLPKRNNFEPSDIYVCDSGHHRIQIINSLDGSFIRSISMTCEFSPLHHGMNIHSSIHEPWSIAILQNNFASSSLNGEPQLIISEYWSSNLKILSRKLIPHNGHMGRVVERWEVKGRMSILLEEESSWTSMNPWTRHERTHQTSQQQVQSQSQSQQQQQHPDYFVCPMGLCVDRASGNIIVSDSMNHRLLVFNSSKGEWMKSFGSFGLNPCKSSSTRSGGINGEKMYAPFGMCVNEWTGELFVVDENNHRVLIFE
ncbi:hypothetical protein FDP41_013699 [Naegleria fowleri]|uniref:Uncharacterized protein n=1 Tax=Naegleria fowleri TaxID=5763 RepID=A0A6A5C4T6_NAEFO|nr:uncharacterized protein FDP41_013699 [Naegleria fowleri]KAF0980485.1 hypothetical protein FDP41_013699 [Naegleria fowleri]CAG4715937.1 unnamed protein product [Naegleria fowleri]